MEFSITVAILTLISILFNLAIAVYSIVGGRPGWVNSLKGCRGDFNGVIGVFNNLDTYLQQVDQAMCSKACPCFLSNTSAFSNNSTLRPYYDMWTKTNQPTGAVAFPNCSIDLQNYAYREAARRDPAFAAKEDFNVVEFFNYMAKVENQFNCVGWCETEYYNPDYRMDFVMAKYLFTDINRGPPQYLSCMNEMIQWLPGYLKAFGSMTIVLVGLQIIIFTLLICQYMAREKDHEKQIPHHHDDNRT
jgi:hypothetical protein